MTPRSVSCAPATRRSSCRGQFVVYEMSVTEQVSRLVTVGLSAGGQTQLGADARPRLPGTARHRGQIGWLAKTSAHNARSGGVLAQLLVDYAQGAAAQRCSTCRFPRSCEWPVSHPQLHQHLAYRPAHERLPASHPDDVRCWSTGTVRISFSMRAPPETGATAAGRARIWVLTGEFAERRSAAHLVISQVDHRWSLGSGLGRGELRQRSVRPCIPRSMAYCRLRRRAANQVRWAVAGRTMATTSADDIEFHYDVGNDFYALWLDETLTYSAALWDGIGQEEATGTALAQAQRAKFAHHLDLAKAPKDGASAGGFRLLDIGCGWGGLLDYAVGTGRATEATGLTLSRAQFEHVIANARPGVEVALESWEKHRSARPYDGIV
jgi:Mycolic acid cyclopropane synthetase